MIAIYIQLGLRFLVSLADLSSVLQQIRQSAESCSSWVSCPTFRCSVNLADLFYQTFKRPCIRASPSLGFPLSTQLFFASCPPVSAAASSSSSSSHFLFSVTAGEASSAFPACCFWIWISLSSCCTFSGSSSTPGPFDPDPDPSAANSRLEAAGRPSSGGFCGLSIMAWALATGM